MPWSCAHIGCPRDAITEIKLPTGWTRLCRRHYDDHYNDEAKRYCAEHHLETLPQKLAFIREKLSGIGKVKNPRQWAYDLMDRHDSGEILSPIQLELARRAISVFARVPGEDDR